MIDDRKNGRGSRDRALLRQVFEIILINIKKYSFFRWFECTNFLRAPTRRVEWPAIFFHSDPLFFSYVWYNVQWQVVPGRRVKKMCWPGRPVYPGRG